MNIRSDKGTALIEAAVTIPILLLVAVGIFEFGRAFQTWQVLTNASREGARHAVTPNSTTASVQGRVKNYMTTGQLPMANSATVSVNKNASITVNGVNESASQVTVDYPFTFIVLNPVVQLVHPGSTTGAPLVMRATALMRNETQ